MLYSRPLDPPSCPDTLTVILALSLPSDVSTLSQACTQMRGCEPQYKSGTCAQRARSPPLMLPCPCAQVGGVPAVLKYLLGKGFIDGSCLTVTGDFSASRLSHHAVSPLSKD